MGRRRGRARAARASFTKLSADRVSRFNLAVALLSGAAYMASISQPITGSGGDVEKARVLIEEAASSKEGAAKAFDVCAEAA